MVSRQETARPLLTPGEVMQLPADDELVLVSGCQPIRAKKARYYEDSELKARILRPPNCRSLRRWRRALRLSSSTRRSPLISRRMAPIGWRLRYTLARGVIR
jgi:type IV secretory pathway TraG/TraD family ATPase VirD4